MYNGDISEGLPVDPDDQLIEPADRLDRQALWVDDWISSLLLYNKTNDIDFFTLICIDSYIDINNNIIFNLPAVGGYLIILTFNEDESFNCIDSLIQAEY